MMVFKLVYGLADKVTSLSSGCKIHLTDARYTPLRVADVRRLDVFNKAHSPPSPWCNRTRLYSPDLRRWIQDGMAMSSELAQDHRNRAIAVRDAVKTNEKTSTSRPISMLQKVFGGVVERGMLCRRTALAASVHAEWTGSLQRGHGSSIQQVSGSGTMK